MKFLITLLMGSLLLVGCASKPPRAEVTRFHLGKSIPAEPFSIKESSSYAASIEYSLYVGYVRDELVRLGFTPVDDDSADLVAEVKFDRGLRPGDEPRSGMSIGIGGGTRGSRIGIGGGISIPVGGSASEVYVNELKVTLIRKSEKAVVWEGTAKTASRKAPEDPAANMRYLATELFAEFPGESQP